MNIDDAREMAEMSSDPIADLTDFIIRAFTAEQKLEDIARESKPPDINYEDDWAGECRVDDMGNGFVLREVEVNVRHLPERGFSVRINDILGGHDRWIDLDEWVTWERHDGD